MDLEALQAAGLYDPDAPNASDRLAVLEYLCERGATVDDMLRAVAMGGLPLLAGELQRRKGKRWLTPQEVADRADVPFEVVANVSRAAGLPIYDVDEPAFREEDVETFLVYKVSAPMFGDPAVLEFTRAAGAAMAMVADAANSAFGHEVAAPMRDANATELEKVKAVENASALLLGQVPDVLITLFFHHVQAAARRELAAGGAFENASVIALAVGFVDLVGSTPMLQQLAPEDFGAAISQFESRAIELAAEQQGRVVKTIGDEVMFVVPDAAGACTVALALRDFVASHPVLTNTRAGIAAGGLVRGYGDFYGPEVNVASRLVKLAQPGSLLVTEAVKQQVVSAGLRFESMGEYTLTGFDTPIAAYGLERA